MRKARFTGLLGALLIANLACSLNVLPFNTSVNLEKIKVGPTQVAQIAVPLPAGAGTPTLEFRVGAGELHLHPGAEGLMEGTVTYNVERLAPSVLTEGDVVIVQQGEGGGGLDLTIPDLSGDYIYVWDLALGSTPMALTILAGATDTVIELGGLSLVDVSISQGASDFELTFSEPNQVEMGTLKFNSGASNAVLSGLGFSHARDIVFKGGAGSYRLQFDGELIQDLHVNVDAGFGEVVIVVPDGPAVAEVQGALSNIDAFGAWTRSGDTYRLDGSGPMISFDITLGVGNLEFRTR